MIAFSGGAFERTIRDMNLALTQQSLLSSEDIQKAHFYRGMAISRLLVTDSESAELPANPYLAAYQDLNKAKLADKAKWEERVNAEMANLVTGLTAQANHYYQQSLTAKSGKISLLGKAIACLQAAEGIQSDFEKWMLFGRVYQKLGFAYLSQNSDRASANFRASARYYELALKQESDCAPCLDGLIAVVTQLNEDARLAHYKALREASHN